MPRGQKQNLIGQTFTRLTVESLSDRDTRRGRWWWCRCQCGERKEVRGDNLTSGRVKSCGCYKTQLLTGKQLKGGRKLEGVTEDEAKGRADHPAEYLAWRRMIASCEDKNSASYATVGGLGVRVCGRWRKSLLNFIKDVGERPSDGHILKRTPGRNFAPGGVAWVPKIKPATPPASPVMEPGIGEF